MLPGLDPISAQPQRNGPELWKLIFVTLMFCLLWCLDLMIYVVTLIYGARDVSFASCLLLLWYFVYFDTLLAFILSFLWCLGTLILVFKLWWKFDVEKKSCFEIRSFLNAIKKRTKWFIRTFRKFFSPVLPKELRLYTFQTQQQE